MSRYFRVTIESGQSICPFYNVYYNNTSTLATLWPSLTPATGLTFSQLTNVNPGVIVVLPDVVSSVIVSGTCGLCQATTQIIPTPTPTIQTTRTPTPTPTLTKTPTVTPSRASYPPIGRPFISVWRTTQYLEQIELPYDPNGFYDGTIQWGDGTSSINTYANRKHTYVQPGQYTVTIYGRVIGWSFDFTCPTN
jgi:hypothetical protein